MTMRVLITGATGMVGSHLCHYLASRGINVTALVRSTSSLERLRALTSSNPLATAVADLCDNRSLESAMQSQDVVVHAAACVDAFGDRDEIFRVNVDGTRSALQVAIKSGVEQFIHVSSLSVISGQADCFRKTEIAPLRYCGEAYADSKVEAEKVVASQFGNSEIACTILRPGFIYGPGERAWMPRLIQSIASRRALLIDNGSRLTNVIYVGNLCYAVEKALNNPRSFGRVYNLTDGEAITKKALFDTIADGLQLPRVSRSVPRPIAALICNAVALIAPGMPLSVKRKLSPLSRAAFRLAAINQDFDISAAVRDLDYRQRTSFHEGMAATMEYFRTVR